MHEEEKCPCDAVKELKTLVMEHEKLLAKGSTHFAVINTKLNTMIGVMAAVGIGLIGIILPMAFK